MGGDLPKLLVVGRVGGLTTPLFVLFFVILGLLSYSKLSRGCSGGPGRQLDFSISALSFSAMFAAVNSTAGRFVVCGHGSRPLLVDRVVLTDNRRANFHVGISKHGNSRFRGMEVRTSSDLCIFIRIAIGPGTSGRPLLISSSVVFAAGKIGRSIHLRTCKRGMGLCGGKLVLARSARFATRQPCLVCSDLIVSPGVALGVSPNTAFCVRSATGIVACKALLTGKAHRGPVIFHKSHLSFVLGSVLPCSQAPSR